MPTTSVEPTLDIESDADQDFRLAGDVALQEQFDNHDGFRPESTPVKVGRTETLVLAEGGNEIRVEVCGEGRATWELGGECGECEFESFLLRDEVTAWVVRIDERRSLFAVVCGERGLAAFATLEGNPDGVSERTRYVQFGVGGSISEPFEKTVDLIGKRIQWRYSSTHSFEHIYLNPTAYCWHCIEGPERWIGDVDPCVYYRLADDLYLFSWSETVVPFNGAVALDLASGTSTGRFFGWDTRREAPDQIVVGARGTLLNQTSYAAAR